MQNNQQRMYLWIISIKAFMSVSVELQVENLRLSTLSQSRTYYKLYSVFHVTRSYGNKTKNQYLDHHPEILHCTVIFYLTFS